MILTLVALWMTRNVEAVRRLMKLTVPGKVEMQMHLVIRVVVAV